MVAQCGGKGNVAEHARAIAAVAARPEFAGHLGEVTGIWNFASAQETTQRLHEAGFSEARCWLEPKPVKPERPLEFTSTATLGPLLAQLIGIVRTLRPKLSRSEEHTSELQSP